MRAGGVLNLCSGVAPRRELRDAHRMRSDFILSNKQRGKKCSEDRFTLKWRTNPTSAITSPLTHIQSSLHGSMWVDVRVRACASDSPPADVAAQFCPAPRAFIASSSAFFFLPHHGLPHWSEARSAS